MSIFCVREREREREREKDRDRGKFNNAVGSFKANNILTKNPLIPMLAKALLNTVGPLLKKVDIGKAESKNVSTKTRSRTYPGNGFGKNMGEVWSSLKIVSRSDPDDDDDDDDLKRLTNPKFLLNAARFIASRRRSSCCSIASEK